MCIKIFLYTVQCMNSNMDIYRGYLEFNVYKIADELCKWI